MVQLSIRAFAKKMQVDESSVRQAIDNGRIEKLANGKIDLESQAVAWSENRDPSKDREESGESNKPALSPYHAAKAKREDYTARLKQQEFEVKAGRLIDKAVVARTIFRFTRLVRDNILNIPGRVASEQAAGITGYMESLLNEHLPGTQVKKILSAIDAGAVERITFNAWEKESRAALEGIANGIPELTDDNDTAT